MTCGNPALITDLTMYFGESLHNANLLIISEDNLFDKKYVTPMTLLAFYPQNSM